MKRGLESNQKKDEVDEPSLKRRKKDRIPSKNNETKQNAGSY